MKKILLATMLCIGYVLFGQVGIGRSNPRGALDINSETNDNNKGLVLPTNSDVNNILNPLGSNIIPGTMIYDSSNDCVRYYQGSDEWSKCMCECGITGSNNITTCDTGISGTYQQGVAMTAGNTVVLTIDVGILGPWSISSNTVNGISFSGSGTFTTLGSQTVTLTASGNPPASGVFSYEFTLGSSTCSRNINFSISTPPSPNLTAAACPGYQMPFAPQGSSVNGVVDGKSFTATYTNYTPNTASYPRGIATYASGYFCGVNAPITTRNWLDNSTLPAHTSMTIKFNKSVSNIRLYQFDIEPNASFYVRLKRNGAYVRGALQLVAQPLNCNYNFWINNNLADNLMQIGNSGTNVAHAIANVGGVWFDEIEIRMTARFNYTDVALCIGSVQ